MFNNYLSGNDFLKACLAAVFAVALTACSSSSDQAAAPPPAEPPAPPPPHACDDGPSQACVDARQAELDALGGDATVAQRDAAQMALDAAQTALAAQNAAAARQGYAPAQAGLGYLHIYGAGVQQDFVLAYMWLELAFRGAPDEFTRRLYAQRRDELADRMTPDDTREGRRRADAWRPDDNP